MSERFPILLERAKHLVVARATEIQAQQSHEVLAVSEERFYDALVISVLRDAVAECALARGMARSRGAIGGRLFSSSLSAFELEVPAADLGIPSDLPLEFIGSLFEALCAERLERRAAGSSFALVPTRRRKQSGSFYTPRALTEVVAERALLAFREELARTPDPERARLVSVCDPALGAGAFLLEAGSQLARELVATGSFHGDDAQAQARRHVALHCLHGVDLNPIAVAVAEASLWLFAGDPSLSPDSAGRGLRHGDALLGRPGPSPEPASGLPSFDWLLEFPGIFERGGFDLVIGNPPWVAYAGRAAQPLEPRLKRYYSGKYRALRGYPTLHGLFVERATELGPRGVIALVVPSPIADLDGYRAVRRAVSERHRVVEPLLEFGQDAFDSVTQPCFALIARPRSTADAAPESDAPDRIWTLRERQHLAASAAAIEVPEVLRALASGPALPAELFGEMGFQTTRVVSERLLCRSAEPPSEYTYPLLEGRDVSEFREGSPRLFLKPDAELLKRARCRLRPESAYAAVRFVVRQTAKVTIAALHRGLPFRNTLLAGFDVAGFEAELCVGLLNSALYRAFHLSLRRDARQAVFPQVKIAHLRALPRPPDDAAGRARITALVGQASTAGVDAELRSALDRAVFDLFGSSADDRRSVLAFLEARAPELGHAC